MLLDLIQLLGLAVVLVGIWVAMLLTAPVGVAMILTGLVVTAVALYVEEHA